MLPFPLHTESTCCADTVLCVHFSLLQWVALINKGVELPHLLYILFNKLYSEPRVSSCSYLALLPPFANLPKGDSLLPFFLFFFFILFIFFIWRGYRGVGRERETHWDESQPSTGGLLHIPRPGVEPITRTCALTRNRTDDLLVPERHTGWGSFFILNPLPSGSHPTPWRHLFLPYPFLSKLTSWPLNYRGPFHHSF